MAEQISISLDEAKNFFEQLTQYKKLLYVIVPHSIGDVIFNAAFSVYVQKRKNKLGTILIVNERMKGLDLDYPHIAGIIYLSTYQLEVLRIYILSTKLFETENTFYGHFDVDEKGLPKTDINLNMVENYRQIVYSLPPDAPFQLPPSPKKISEQNISELKQKYFIDKERTVIIFPQANSDVNLPPKFWEVLTERLKAKNYKVYTNIAATWEQLIAGTEPLTANFRELYWLSKQIRCVIGLRSGIFDFLAATSDVQIFSVAYFPHDSSYWHELSPKCNVKIFQSITKFIAPLAEQCRKYGVNVNIRLTHKKVKPEEIYLSSLKKFSAKKNRLGISRPTFLFVKILFRAALLFLCRKDA